MHTSHTAHAGGETITLEEEDNPSISEGTKDEPINETDVTLANLNYSANRRACASSLLLPHGSQH